MTQPDSKNQPSNLIEHPENLPTDPPSPQETGSHVLEIATTTAQRATKERLDTDKIIDDITTYEGPAFTESSQENAPLIEFLQRLKASNGRYFGNIVHQGARDHSGMAEHSGNEGEYDNEIEQVIASGD